jgi:hypothetical protein
LLRRPIKVEGLRGVLSVLEDWWKMLRELRRFEELLEGVKRLEKVWGVFGRCQAT